MTDIHVGFFGDWADFFLVRDELEAGRLVTPFEMVVTEHTGYYFFCQRDRREEPRIAAFRSWVIAEARKDEDDLRLAESALETNSVAAG